MLHISNISLEEINSHTNSVWQCSVLNPTDKEKAPFLDWIIKLDRLFKGAGINQIIFVQLITGCDSSNGHAFIYKGIPTAWISTSNYPTENSIKVFATHEIVHAIHYGSSTEYTFETKEEKDHVGRQLVTEGIATYVTQQLLSISDAEALWSDYLAPEDLVVIMKKYEQHLQESASNILRDWDERGTEYFYSSDKSDVDKYRSGYYLGRLVIERIIENEKIDIISLLSMGRKELDQKVILQLKSIAIF